MANNIRLLVTTNKNNLVAFAAQQNGPSAWFYRKLETLIGQLGLGAFNSSVVVVPNLVAATGTITFSALANNDTVTVNGRIYTAKTSGATGLQQFNLGANDTAAAVNFAAILNADTSTSIKGVVTASPAAAVTTITCSIPGNIGNACTLAISAHGSVSAANLAGGTEGTTATYRHGL